MLKRTRPSFNKVKELLLRRKKEVEEELKAVEKEDPVFSDDLAESADSGSDNWLAEAHGKTVAIKISLQQLLSKIQTSILRINKGKYDKCESCGKRIEEARLKAMPVATMCISCSKKKSK